MSLAESKPLPGSTQMSGVSIYGGGRETNGSTPILRKLLFVLATGLLIGDIAANPLNIRQVTKGEMARLPEYCSHTNWIGVVEATRANPSTRQRELEALMGTVFWHLHHYCWAQLSAIRATSVGIRPEVRMTLYANAIQDVTYVLDRAPANFALIPEMLFRLGQYHFELGRPGEALEALERSRSVKPDYWPAYLELSKVNMSIRRRAKAVEILRQGLSVLPDEPNLLEALKALESGVGARTVRPSPKATQR